MKPVIVTTAILVCLIFGVSCKKDSIANNAGGTTLYKTEFIQGYPGGKVVTVYYFNVQGLDSAETNTVYDKDGTRVLTTYTRIFEYDANGKLLKYTNIDDNTPTYVVTVTRDSKGRIAKSMATPARATLTYGFAYNDKDQVIADTTYYYTGELVAYYTYQYDDKGNAVTQDTYTGYFHPIQHDGTFTWKYDDKPNPFSGPAFREALIAQNGILLLGTNNATGEYAGTENANIPVAYNYFNNGLIKSGTSHYTQDNVKYEDVTNYYYK